MKPQGIRREALLRVLPGEELDRATWCRDELACDLLREATLVRVPYGAAADAGDRGNERQRHEQEPDGTDGHGDARPIGAEPPAAALARRHAEEPQPAAAVRPVERRGREERAQRQPDELRVPPERAKRS